MDSLKDIPDEVDEADFVGRTDFPGTSNRNKLMVKTQKTLDDAITIIF